MKKFLAGLFLIAFTLPVCAQSKMHKYLEKDYQNAWCKANGGSLEVVFLTKQE